MALSTRLRPQVTTWYRLVEWFLVAVLILTLLLVFTHYARQVKSQSELATIKMTVGTLRTALVLDHLQRQLPPVRGAASPLTASRNPFDLVEPKPLGYLGEITKVQAESAAPGSWFYVDDCACIGYRPLDDAALNSASGALVIWYQQRRTAGIVQLIAKEAYLWADLTVD